MNSIDPMTLNNALIPDASPKPRHRTIGVRVGEGPGSVIVGGDAPIVVQSMTNTDTADIEGTVNQVAALALAGSEIVRITVDRADAAAAVPRIKEKLLDIDPKDAHQELKRRRIDVLLLKGATDANVKMGPVKKRASITTLQFLAKAQEVIQENREYWPLTVRRVHYLLLNDPPLRHDKKSDSVYMNDKASYKALTNLLIRARLSKEVQMPSICPSSNGLRQFG